MEGSQQQAVSVDEVRGGAAPDPQPRLGTGVDGSATRLVHLRRRLLSKQPRMGAERARHLHLLHGHRAAVRHTRTRSLPVHH